ncbi:MAG: hypothetical protein ACAH95_00300 [Fimbriimonas sp.]
MLLALLAITPAAFQSGAYGMRELMVQFGKADGLTYSADADLQDYPVFVNVKSGDVATARKLAAAAVYGKWTLDANKYRLSSIKPTKGEGFETFEKEYNLVAAAKGVTVPAKDAFALAPGEIARYGPSQSPYYRPLPPGTPKEITEIKFRRFGPKVFESAMGQDFEFDHVPDNVRKAVGAALKEEVLNAEQRDAFNDKMKDPDKMQLDWKDINKSDPVAAIGAPLLKGLAAQLPMDFATVLPDFSIFPPMKAASGDGTVEAYLSAYAMSVDWEIVDGALVGRLPITERLMPSQTKRDVLAKLIAAMRAQGIGTTDVLSSYVSNQRPYASESWLDVMMLVLAGKSFDQEYIGDYPHNIRLYAALTAQDWELIRSGKFFPASNLTPRVQSLLIPLLVQSRAVMAGIPSDPASWPNLTPTNLLVKAELVDEDVLIGFTGFGASVYDVQNSAANHNMRMQELKREPLYQPAKRRRLRLTITHEPTDESVEKGFSDVMPDPKFKPVIWTQLPEEIMKSFKARLAGG